MFNESTSSVGFVHRIAWATAHSAGPEEGTCADFRWAGPPTQQSHPAPFIITPDTLKRANMHACADLHTPPWALLYDKDASDRGL